MIMLHSFFVKYVDEPRLLAIYAFFAFVLTAILLRVNFRFLPVDHGRVNAVDGELSKGKTRGVGFVMMLCFAVCIALFLPFRVESAIYALILIAEMLSGYLDDASKIPWSDYKKGLIDFVLSAGVGIVFVLFNPSTIAFGSHVVTLPRTVYAILATILVWMAINAVNCTDGVDGLSSSVGIVSIASMLLIYRASFEVEYMGFGMLFIAVLAAYLLFNASPSSQLMGDAGSRPLGILLALLAMKSGHPLCFLLLCAVFILDGITGLVKIFLKRFFRISILKNIRTPLHDEVRKNRGWSDPQVVIRFAIIQILFSVIWYITTL
jgi:phospho-N-acetylmuramoyl-pentapeptide-transferase